MRLTGWIQILTLVLSVNAAASSAHAAPSAPSPGTALRPSQTPAPAKTLPPELDRAESLDTGVKTDAVPELSTPDSAASKNIVNGIIPTRIVRARSRIVDGGIVSGAIDGTSPRTMPWVTLTFQEDFPDETARSYGLGVADRDIWGVHWDMHRYCCLGAYSEPYWGLGIGSFYDSREQLAALVNIESFHLRARAGFDDLFNLGRRLRAEFVVRAGLLGASVQIGIGWTFAADKFLF